MLSAETAAGDHPIDSVRMLTRIALEVEGEVSRANYFQANRRRTIPGDLSAKEALVHSAVELAERAGARYIVVFALRGGTTRLIARHRPSGVGILGFTPYEHVRRRLALCWNTQTLSMPVTRDPYTMMNDGVRILKQEKLVKRGDTIVIVAGDAPKEEASNLLRLVTV